MQKQNILLSPQGINNEKGDCEDVVPTLELCLLIINKSKTMQQYQKHILPYTSAQRNPYQFFYNIFYKKDKLKIQLLQQKSESQQTLRKLTHNILLTLMKDKSIKSTKHIVLGWVEESRGEVHQHHHRYFFQLPRKISQWQKLLLIKKQRKEKILGEKNEDIHIYCLHQKNQKTLKISIGTLEHQRQKQAFQQKLSYLIFPFFPCHHTFCLYHLFCFNIFGGGKKLLCKSRVNVHIIRQMLLKKERKKDLSFKRFMIKFLLFENSIQCIHSYYQYSPHLNFHHCFLKKMFQYLD